MKPSDFVDAVKRLQAQAARDGRYVKYLPKGGGEFSLAHIEAPSEGYFELLYGTYPAPSGVYAREVFHGEVVAKISRRKIDFQNEYGELYSLKLI